MHQLLAYIVPRPGICLGNCVEWAQYVGHVRSKHAQDFGTIAVHRDGHSWQIHALGGDNAPWGIAWNTLLLHNSAQTKQ